MNYRTRVATIYLLGFFIDLVNMFIANIAYPKISHQFNVSVSQLTWVSNGYILGLTLVMPLSRWLVTRVGAKRLYIISLIIFILGTSGVAAASSIGPLIIWRVMQGIGGGILIPVGQTMAYALYPSNERAKLSSVVMLVALMAPALSPMIGGALVDYINWRWIFLVSVPLALLTLMLTAYWLKPDTQTGGAEPLDTGGLITGCVALTLLLLGLTYLGDSFHQGEGILFLVVGLVFTVYHIRNALGKIQPLLNLRLIQIPLLQTAMLIYLLIPGVFTGVNLITVIFLQNQLGMHATLVGMMMLPWSVASFLAISFTGKTFNRIGPRPLFLLGCIVQGVGIGLLMLVASADDIIITAISYALMGFGGSLCSSTAQSAAFIQVNDGELADASSLWNINRQLSFCFGVTLISLLFNLLRNLCDMSLTSAYHWCFALTAASTVIPIIICLRISNISVITMLNQEK